MLSLVSVSASAPRLGCGVFRFVFLLILRRVVDLISRLIVVIILSLLLVVFQ
jgi:hypothetical protein